MRKYYKPVNIRKRDVTAHLSTQVDPWALLGAFMQGARSLLSPDLAFLAEDAILKKSVKSYLALSKLVDVRTQLYTKDTANCTVWCERQLAALLKKYPFSPSMSDLDSTPCITATEKWSESEVKCRETNMRLRSNKERPSWLLKSKLLAAKILGDLEPSVVMKIITEGAHGPGSTRTNKGRRLSSYYKYADLPYSCTRSALPYAYAAITSDPKWIKAIRQRVQLPTIPIAGASPLQVELMYLSRAIEVVDCDKITFVPKDCQTDRPIAVGSSLNIFLQLGVKSYLEARLKLFGVDLTDQTKNQRFAYLGSRYSLRDDEVNLNQFSTVDLASASDTISIELVREILPPDWFAFLSDLRHSSGELPDKSIHTYEKFSAMGNGYTFPLESLIFFCICKSTIEDSGHECGPNDITVFGDDIIIRRRHYETVLSSLEWSGFSVNSAKSFVEGPFKESCGVDYFLGTNVRPFYLKRLIRTREDVYFTCNSLLRIFLSNELSAPWIHSMYDYLLSLIPSRYLSYGPMDGDSSYLNVPFRAMPNHIRPFLRDREREALIQAHIYGDCYQNSPVVVRTLVVSKKYRARGDVLYLMWLRQTIGTSSFEWVAGRLMPKQESVDYATRRDSISRCVSVSSVLNWDAEFTSQQVVRALQLVH